MKASLVEEECQTPGSMLASQWKTKPYIAKWGGGKVVKEENHKGIWLKLQLTYLYKKPGFANKLFT